MKLRSRPPCLWRAAALLDHFRGEKQNGEARGLGDRDTPPTKNHASKMMDLFERVKAHTRRLGMGERVRYGRACPCCGATEERDFRVDECRRRKFRVVLGRCIHVVLSWILRWRCLRCGKRFTDYPPFRVAT